MACEARLLVFLHKRNIFQFVTLLQTQGLSAEKRNAEHRTEEKRLTDESRRSTDEPISSLAIVLGWGLDRELLPPPRTTPKRPHLRWGAS